MNIPQRPVNCLTHNVKYEVLRHAEAPSKNDRVSGQRSLLVPIDFSEHSGKTIEYATQLAALMGATIKILHILQMPEYTTGLYRGIYIQPELVKGMVEAAQHDANEKLSLAMRDVRAKGLQAQSILRVGTPYEEIVSVADEMDIDLIVIGSHGYRDFGRSLLGSTAARVLQYARCPVLVVKDVPVDRLAARNGS